ncbi:MAG TPA: DUF1064 domain-containing protein [Burkholderiaceae bacterium]|nr:DUF1064 domain-containing protein [Burkholderiaceae bacterium]
MADEMAASDYVALMERQKKPRSKYRAQRVRIDGHTFPSKLEGARYLELKQMEDLGLISDLELQPSFDLKGESGAIIARYQADFSYWELNTEYPQNDPPYGSGEFVIEDTKGMANRLFALKRKWLKADHGIDLRITTSKDVDTRGMDAYVIEDEA